MIPPLPRPTASHQPRGFALVLVLAFIVLLVGVCLAFFSNSILQRQISNSSAEQVKVGLLATGAIDTTIGDLKQEIAAGSDNPNPPPFDDGSVLYSVSNPLKMVPEKIGTGVAAATDLPNVLKTSTGAAFTGGVDRTSSVPTTDVSGNGRFMDAARWNKPLLMTPKGATDSTPPTSFTVPNWILVSKDPATPNPKKPNADVIGRYAYVVYDEGGLLDINVAGYPGVSANLTSTAAQNDMRRKMGLPSVDLRELKDDSGTQVLLSDADIDKLIKWRNAVTAPQIEGAGNDTRKSAAFSQYVRSAGGFLQSGGQGLNGGRSDVMFVGRQQLIDFAQTQLAPANLNALQYLTTFTRGLDQPSIAPDPTRPKVVAANQGGNDQAGLNQDDIVNPSFLSIRVASDNRGRNDGTNFIKGEPLVKKRFALERLAWLTREGPSAIASATIKQELLDAGIPQGMVDQGTAVNIQKYFGLNWGTLASGGDGWTYNVHNNGSGEIPTLRDIANRTAGADAHEPDFFELLKAAIDVGSLGKAATDSNTAGAATSPYVAPEVAANYRYNLDTSIDHQIIQIGANIIDQADGDSFPTRIVFDDGTLQEREFSGVEDLPYLNYVFQGMVRTSVPHPRPTAGGNRQFPVANTGGTGGEAVFLQIPALWNPHDVNSTLHTAATGRGLPRPTNFRIVATSVGPSGISHTINTAGLAKTLAGTDAISTPVPTTITESNTAITFSDQNGLLFREPTLLLRPGGDPNVQSANVFRAPEDKNLVRAMLEPPNTPYIGIPLGTFPLMFTSGGEKVWTGRGLVGPSIPASVTLFPTPFYLTYKVQYSNTAGPPWITYDTKYAKANSGVLNFSWGLDNATGNNPSFFQPTDFTTNPKHSWSAALDPRTSRFGLFVDESWQDPANTNVGPGNTNDRWEGWIYDQNDSLDEKKAITLTIRPDFETGYSMSDPVSTSSTTTDAPLPSESAGWAESRSATKQNLFLGMYSQNNPKIVARKFKRFFNDVTPFDETADTSDYVAFYTDPDGVVRRAMGAYVAANSNTTVGLPLAATQRYDMAPTGINRDPLQGINQAQSRPLILNRPFRSVAELGYVFRDTPWKNLDFFTPESGDSALLDVFCISDTSDSNGLTAGKINVNEASVPLLSAIIAGAYIDDPKISDVQMGALSRDASRVISQTLVSRIKTPANAQVGPLANVSELIGKWTGAQPVSSGSLTGVDGALSYTGFVGSSATDTQNLGTALANSGIPAAALKSMTNIQRLREAPIRALSNVIQTRVWNIMVDMVAQSGRYPQGVGAAAKFMVEGEQRLWVHLAIDRLTGKVIDKQVEVVNE